MKAWTGLRWSSSVSTAMDLNWSCLNVICFERKSSSWSTLWEVTGSGQTQPLSGMYGSGNPPAKAASFSRAMQLLLQVCSSICRTGKLSPQLFKEEGYIPVDRRAPGWFYANQWKANNYISAGIRHCWRQVHSQHWWLKPQYWGCSVTSPVGRIGNSYIRQQPAYTSSTDLSNMLSTAISANYATTYWAGSSCCKEIMAVSPGVFSSNSLKVSWLAGWKTWDNMTSTLSTGQDTSAEAMSQWTKAHSNECDYYKAGKNLSNVPCQGMLIIIIIIIKSSGQGLKMMLCRWQGDVSSPTARLMMITFSQWKQASHIQLCWRLQCSNSIQLILDSP